MQICHVYRLLAGCRQDDDKKSTVSSRRSRERDDKESSSSRRSRKDKDRTGGGGEEKKEKAPLVSVERQLLLAFSYFDQSHTGYLLDKDCEDILHIIGLHLSRSQVRAPRHCRDADSHASQCIVVAFSRFSLLFCTFANIVVLMYFS